MCDLGYMYACKAISKSLHSYACTYLPNGQAFILSMINICVIITTEMNKLNVTGTVRLSSEAILLPGLLMVRTMVPNFKSI